MALQEQQLNEIEKALEEMTMSRDAFREKLHQQMNERLEELKIKIEEESTPIPIMEPSPQVVPQVGSSKKLDIPQPLGWRGQFHQTPPYHSPSPLSIFLF